MHQTEVPMSALQAISFLFISYMICESFINPTMDSVQNLKLSMVENQPYWKVLRIIFTVHLTLLINLFNNVVVAYRLV